MNYYIGLDNGGTTTKSAIYDQTGNEIAVASIDTNTISGVQGFAERDMELMWDNNCTVIEKVIEKSNINPKDIKCIAVCGHGKGLYLWGKNDKPAMMGIGSTDNRAWKYPIKWENDGTAKEVFQISYQHIMPYQPVSLLAWLKDHRPEVIENTQWIFSCKDYIRFRLTDKPYAEYSDYSGSNLVNLETKEYDRKLLALFGLGDLMYALPPLRYATDICGTITKKVAERTGLLEGTPVAGGLFDINACALAVGITNDENICMIAGTWSINEYIRKTPVLDGTAWMNSIFAIKDYYLIEECSPTSAGNQEWILKNFFPELMTDKKAAYCYINEEINKISPKEFCPLFMPFILGTNVHPNAKGTFIGITQNHTRAHFFRSIYEGICFSHKYHLDRLLKTRSEMPKTIRLSGGVTNSAPWTQMFADVLQIPIEIVSAKETGTLGCAICASVACGDKNNIEDAVNSMTHIVKTIYPDKDKAEIYTQKYNLYLKAISCLDDLWGEMQKLQ